MIQCNTKGTFLKPELPRETTQARNREEERFFKASSSFKAKNLLITAALFLIYLTIVIFFIPLLTKALT
jgi:hypothetical protein